MKRLLLYIGIGVILLAIPATIFLVSQQQELRKHAAPATTLALTPSAVSQNPGDTFRLNVTLDPATNQVVTAKIFVTFDPTKLKATTITNGPNAPKVLNSGVVGNGTASITVAAASTSQPITQKGSVAVISFKALAGTGTTPTEVKFASNTFVGGLKEPTANVLIGTTGAKVAIKGDSTTPTTTPTATPSATPTGRLTPTLTPTLKLTPTATPSGTATPSAITIVSPSTNAQITSTTPVIEGTAPPGATVTLVIYSTPQTVVVTADASGRWTYSPTNPLDTGPHNIVASYQTASGSASTATTAFVVVAGAGAGGGTSSDTAMPVSGSVETTITLIGVAILLIVSGALIPVVIP